MSVFNNHLDSNVINRDSDKMILEHYRISNSGSTLIPITGSYLAKKITRGRTSKTEKIPQGTFKEERSIFRSMYGGIASKETKETIDKIYQVFKGIILEMHLPCLIYNQKCYYQVNREIKRRIDYQIHKEVFAE